MGWFSGGRGGGNWYSRERERYSPGCLRGSLKYSVNIVVVKSWGRVISKLVTQHPHPS